jgi:ribosomal protein S18 acetylase RimI-like enzyme
VPAVGSPPCRRSSSNCSTRARSSGSDALDDTWAGGDRVAEMQTLVVSEGARSRGVGARLLQRAEAEVVSRGIGEMIIGAVATNDGAIRFYEAHGYVPYWVGMYRRLG